MLFLAVVIGVSLPGLSWTQDFMVNIGNVVYKAECTIQGVPLVNSGCPKQCAPDKIKTCVVKGIPYATASRFGKPQPLDPTMREELAKESQGNIQCAQTHPFNGGEIGVENCLVIDLYFPQDWNVGASSSLVVLIEGIDFESSLAGFLQPDSHLDSQLGKHMIAVVHYRTGVFGFMTLQNQLMPANLGLWDQQMALQFLKSESKALSVEEDFIVLGFGSGAAALHLHMLNPVSRGLFKKVLLSGGNALSPGVLQSDALNTTLTLANRLKCDTSSMESVANCLRGKSTEEILKQSKTEPALRFAASEDSSSSDSKSQNAFISAPLDDLVRAQQLTGMEVIIHSYPYLAGLNQFARNEDKESTDDIKYLANFFDMYSDGTAESVARIVLDQHYKGGGVKEKVSNDPMQFINLLTDFAVGYPVNSLVSTQVKQNEGNKVALASLIVFDNGQRTAEGATVPTLASKLKSTQMKESNVKERFGSTIDDMLLFVGCQGIPILTRNPDGTTYGVAKVINDNAKMMSEAMQCLLDKDVCSYLLGFDESLGHYTGQKSPTTENSEPYRFKEVSRWSSVLALASAMDKLEVENRALRKKKGTTEGVKSAGFSFWAMLVGLMVLAVVSILLVGVVVKMLRHQRRETSHTPVEKPARSTAHYNAGMESVTVEEGNRL